MPFSPSGKRKNTSANGKNTSEFCSLWKSRGCRRSDEISPAMWQSMSAETNQCNESHVVANEHPSPLALPAVETLPSTSAHWSQDRPCRNLRELCATNSWNMGMCLEMRPRIKPGHMFITYLSQSKYIDITSWRLQSNLVPAQLQYTRNNDLPCAKITNLLESYAPKNLLLALSSPASPLAVLPDRKLRDSPVPSAVATRWAALAERAELGRGRRAKMPWPT